MIFSKCSLRISLAGGSTDLQEFVDSNGYGTVISFPCDLYTYISLFHDRNGLNNFSKKYIINYRQREETDSPNEIKNDIAKEVINYFGCGPLNMCFFADVFSEGSGLASSSSYLLACIKAVVQYQNIPISDHEICNIALQIERNFNPLTGYQDIYGCGISGFKRINFSKEKKGVKIKIDHLPPEFLKCFDMYLIYTGIKRKSTNLLKTLDLNKVEKILPLVNFMESSIRNNDFDGFFSIINEGWAKKKETSSEIMSNPTIQELDGKLSNDPSVLAHKLCGAGGGGYFLVFKKKYSILNLDSLIKINLSDRAITCKTI